MRFNRREKELIAIYYAGSCAGTIDELTEALIYMDGQSERAEVINLLDKLEVMSEKEFTILIRETGLAA